MIIKKELLWAGRNFSIETGNWANQADGSVVVRYGDTAVLCTVVADKKCNSDADFFPLTVNYVEKAYAAGKIPGGYVKREGKPSEHETLVSRLIDRPLRPLFHENFKNETQIICTVLSFDGKNDADVISIIGASAALAISGIPFVSIIAAARIGYKNGEYMLNPTIGHKSDLDLVVAGSKDGILMVESGARELSEEEMLGALKFGHEAFQPIISMIEEIASVAAKKPWPIPEENPAVTPTVTEITKVFSDDIVKAYTGETKHDRNAALSEIFTKIVEHFAEKELSEQFLSDMFTRVCSDYVRNKVLETKTRIDNRGTTDIRPISVDVSVLPMVHGSAVFKRGETQALAIATLGSAQDEQSVDGLKGESSERFMLHYNFPPFSVGEIGRLGAPGRREIGHGKLAWRAVSQVIPEKGDFAYTIRVVSEVLSCNGSSSMATICAASQALMDAGVPLKNHVAGIAMGLIMEGDRYEILSDIMGEEDHLGDMDFKVAGTENGITALQMDIKVTSVTFEIMEQAVQQAKKGREHILSAMKENGLSQPRADLNPNAPKMTTFTIARDKIREVIGSGGKVIREIIEKTGAKVDIDDNGTISVYAPNSHALDNAVRMISEIAYDPIEGTMYDATVVRIMDFGAFVRFYGTREGLLHISEMGEERVEKVTDVMNEGDVVRVKFCGYDSKGRARLKMKETAATPEAERRSMKCKHKHCKD